MRTVDRSVHLFAAVAAAAVTFALFAGVVSLAEPQRGTLIAQTAAQRAAASASTAVHLAQSP